MVKIIIYSFKLFILFTNLIIDDYFRWKGLNESSVLRTEVNLFSGFQLCSVNKEDIDNMVQYGTHDNKVWFILNKVNMFYF